MLFDDVLPLLMENLEVFTQVPFNLLALFFVPLVQSFLALGFEILLEFFDILAQVLCKYVLALFGEEVHLVLEFFELSLKPIDFWSEDHGLDFLEHGQEQKNGILQILETTIQDAAKNSYWIPSQLALFHTASNFYSLSTDTSAPTNTASKVRFLKTTTPYPPFHNAKSQFWEHPMNRSSSFYSEEYHERMRKMAHIKKPVYRERHKELYDQQHQLQILHYYKNLSGRCEMMKYFEIINQVYMELKEKNIRNNEDYNNGVEAFFRSMKNRIAYFHQHIICREYITRQQYIHLDLHSAEDTRLFWKKLEANKQQKHAQQGSPLNQEKEADDRLGEETGRVETCNLCPITVEEFQFNFDKCIDTVKRNCEYWDQLNGHQKVNKLRSYMEQNLKVLHYELERNCEYAIKNSEDSESVKRTRRRRRK